MRSPTSHRIPRWILHYIILFPDFQSSIQPSLHFPHPIVAAAGHCVALGAGIGRLGSHGNGQCHPHPEVKVPQCVGWGASSLPLIQEASVSGSLLSAVGCCEQAGGKGDLLIPDQGAGH